MRSRRLCPVCLEEGHKSRMKHGRRHLHELEPGTRVRFPHDGRAKAYQVDEVASSRCHVSEPSQFVRGGRVVEGRRRRPVAGGAEVIVIEAIVADEASE